MAKWIMPHEQMPEELVAPVAAKPRYILPHEVEAAKAAEKTLAEKQLESEDSSMRVGIGAGKVISDIVQGAKQRFGQITGNEALVKEMARRAAEEKQYEDAISKDPYAVAGRIGANVGLGLLSPSARMLPAAATGFVTEGVLKPFENPTLGNVLTEGGKGALGYALGAGALSSAVTGAAKAKNAMQGRFANPEQERRLRIFQENGVPASLGDITQNPTIMGIENAAQYVPFSGRKEFMERQAQRAGEVIEGAPAKIAGQVAGESKEAAGNVIAKSIKDKYQQTKDTARTLYDDVSTRVQAVGAPPVPVNNLNTSVNTLLSKYPSVFAKLGDDPDTVNTLVTIAKGTHPSASSVLGPNGQPIMKPAQLSFDELRQLDSDIGSMIRQGRQLSSRGELNNKSFNQLVDVQKALRKDIEDWSKSVGDEGISKGVTQANKYFRENVMPFRTNPVTRKVVQDQEVNLDTLPNQFFKLDSPYLSSQAQQFMTPEGIQAGRFHLLQQAKSKAMDEALSSGYSPGRFVKGTELGETGPKLFSTDELGQLDDLQELIRSSRRASGYAADPATGNRLLGLTPFVSWKIPMAARAFSTATQSESPLRFMLADPTLYTGKGGLGKASEALLRKGAIGPTGDALE